MSQNGSAPREFLRHLDRILGNFLGGLLPQQRRYWILVPVVGLISGLLSVGLGVFLDLVEVLAWGKSGSVLESATQLAMNSPGTTFAVLATGGLIVAAALSIRKRSDELQGTSAVIEALALRKGRLPVMRTLLESFVSITAVGTGASLGREGAMIQSGASVASFLGAKLRLDDYHVKILLACGAAGGMAASYNVPVGASVFAMEVLLCSFALEMIGPILISAFIATTVSRAITGGLPAYSIPHYELVTEWEILLDVVLGTLIGLISVIFIRVFSGLGQLSAWLRRIDRVKPVLAMVILGAVGMWFPQLFGNGYDTVNLVLVGDTKLDLSLLIVLPVLKILVTAICRAGGVPGGLFTPSLFIGALLGGAFGTAIHALFPDAEGVIAKPGAYALVGMGAILAGTIQAPITAILMIFEMTRDYEIIVPLMSACAASSIVSRLFQEGSLFTEPLRRRGIRLPRAITPAWIRQPSIRSILQPDMATVSPAERFKQVVDKFLTSPADHDQVYVISKEGAFMGSISLHDIKRYFRETEHLDSVIAADVVDSAAPFVCAEEPVSRAIEMLSGSDMERLPVLDNPGDRKLLGTVSKRRLLAAYTETNIAQEGPGLT